MWKEVNEFLEVDRLLDLNKSNDFLVEMWHVNETSR